MTTRQYVSYCVAVIIMTPLQSSHEAAFTAKKIEGRCLHCKGMDLTLICLRTAADDVADGCCSGASSIANVPTFRPETQNTAERRRNCRGLRQRR
jgi:hypothetical protein